MSILSHIYEHVLSPGHRIATTGEELQFMVQHLRQAHTRALDFETDGLDFASGRRPIGAALGYRATDGAYYAWYVPWAHRTGEAQADPSHARRAVADALHGAPELVMHGGKFDLNMARADGIRVPDVHETRLHDTLVQGTLCYELRQFQLEKLVDDDGLSPWGNALEKKDEVERFLNDRAKARRMRKRKSEWQNPSYMDLYGHSEIPVRLEGEYACRDIVHTLILDTHQRARAQGAGLPERVQQQRLKLYHNEMLLVRALADMEWAGQAVDVDYLIDLYHTTQEQQEVRFAEVTALFGASINWGNDNQLRRFLYKDLGLPVAKLTESGSPSVDRSALLGLANVAPRRAEALKALGEYKVWSKVETTYSRSLAAQVSTDGRVHASFVQQGTKTGRLSGRNPNLQNMPKRHQESAKAVRRAFVIEPGQARVYCDYSQIELRVLAWATSSSTLLGAYKSPAYDRYLAGQSTYAQYVEAREHEAAVDVHGLQAKATFGAKESDEDWDTKRRAAKIINFGVPYGMGPAGLMGNPDLRLPEAQAKAYYQTYQMKNPEIQRTKDALFRSMLAEQGTPRFTNWAGRARHSPRLRSPREEDVSGAERSLFASLIQGSAGELTRFSLVVLWWEQKCGRLPAVTTSTVHDEIQVDCSRKDVTTVAREVRRIMEDFPGQFGPVPVVADLEITTTNWAEIRKDWEDK